MKIIAAVPMFLMAATAGATEIATGKMLGSGYDDRAFYVRGAASSKWQKTYTGPEYRPEAAGKLMNLRVAQALFHDEWLTEEPFDPAKHTDRVIAALDAWKKSGVLSISVSLQGGNPAYERTETIQRKRPAALGPGKGTLTSAFDRDGALKPEWMGRALKLARELDRRGMVLNLIYFYSWQDEAMSGPEAIERATANATDWLIDNGLRNVIIEIANEVDSKEFDYDGFIRTRLGRLIELARGRFTARRAGFRLPISASTQGGTGMPLLDAVRDHADLVILHGNHKTAAEKGRRVKDLLADAKAPGPILFNEDDNGRDTDGETLSRELASCEEIFRAGGSWGYMPWVQLQIYPFRTFDPTGVEGRDAAYFRSVLDKIRSLVYR